MTLHNKYGTPHTCPICLGRGFVQSGFYSTTTGYWDSTDTSTESCRTCSGTGIVWGYGSSGAKEKIVNDKSNITETLV